MHEIIIEPTKNLKNFWRELWAYRELFLFLAWRDILVRYKQTVIGMAWSVLRPLLSLLILTVVFGRVARLPSDNVPYSILVCAAILPWQFFSNTITMSSESLLNNQNMVTKIYFPRIIIPSTTMVVSLVDFLCALGILACLMVWHGLWPTWRIVALPALLLLAALASLGVGYWISALNVKYRDFRHVVPFAVQFGLYVSPVGFSSNIIPDRWRLYYSLNPMVGVIDGFRWTLLGGQGNLYLPSFLLSTVLTLAIFVGGVRFFTHTERTFADII
jgi:lipopolysaccharide transport system permease protein